MEGEVKKQKQRQRGLPFLSPSCCLVSHFVPQLPLEVGVEAEGPGALSNTKQSQGRAPWPQS